MIFVPRTLLTRFKSTPIALNAYSSNFGALRMCCNDIVVSQPITTAEYCDGKFLLTTVSRMLTDLLVNCNKQCHCKLHAV